MREKFALDLYTLMAFDKRITLITADLGFGIFNKMRDNLPDQFYNVMAAEQVMMGVAIGMALSGKIPVTYTITPFLFRAFESIRNYVDHEQIPVIMVGSGRAKDYDREGFSHDATDHGIIFKSFKNIVFLTPNDNYNLREIIYSGKPTYLNLKR
jgi:transketolase